MCHSRTRALQQAAFCTEVAPLFLLPHPLFDADIVAAKTFGSTGSRRCLIGLSILSSR